jgi:uncharacterized protein YciI
VFVVIGTYVRPMEEVRNLLGAHYAFLRKHFDQGHFIVSGRREPLTGTVILAQPLGRRRLEAILDEDPFVKAGIIRYEIVAFVPALFDRKFKPFVG